jgi:serine protease AprX
VLICFCTSAFSFSGSNKREKTYWIFFKDKGISCTAFMPGTDVYQKTLAGLSHRALHRRSTVEPITIEDVAIYEPYLRSLRALAITPITSSKWLNGITASLDEQEAKLVQSLPFVSGIEPVAVAITNAVNVSQSLVFVEPVAIERLSAPQAITIACGYDSIIYHYGFAASQLSRINVPALHAMGFDATGIAIGFFDTGFNHEGMRTTRDRNIVETYDFVYDDSIVHDDASDPFPVDDHGSVVLSAAIGYLPDSIIGSAYNATVYLGKTEDARSETPAEEGYYAQALEWLEARGADIASSSLGYQRYDSGFQSITYPMLDGKTTVAARAALKAARRGMLVVTAAGNSGRDVFPYVLTPGDADSIITVGALMENNSIADFSSRGPTSDGRIKPEICAPGASVMSVNRHDMIKGGGGTSLATPLVSSACALIMQAHPEATAQAVRSAIMKTGIRFGPPDTAYGYGRLDAYAAALELGTIIGPHRQWRNDSIHHICVALAANNKIKNPKIIYAVGESGLFTNSAILNLVSDSLIYTAIFPPLHKGKLVRYYIETHDGADTTTRSPRNAPLAYYEFHVGDTIIIDSQLSVINSKPIADAVYVYPNPAIDKFFVSSSYPQAMQYHLFDIEGNEVLQFNSTADASQVEVRFGSLPAGIYVLHGQLPDGHVVVRQKILRVQ